MIAPSPVARPSRPSIRLTALVTATTHSRVAGREIQTGRAKVMWEKGSEM